MREFWRPFVATPLDETLFVGLYEIGEVRKAPSGTLDPLSNKDVSGYHFYELALSQELGDYRGRLILELGYRVPKLGAMGG